MVIRIDFTAESEQARFPDGKNLGRIDEHNATELMITPPEDMASDTDIISFKIEYQVNDAKISSQLLQITDGKIKTSVPISAAKARLIKLQLVGFHEEETKIIRSELISGLRFDDSVEGSEAQPEDPSGVEATLIDHEGRIHALEQSPGGSNSWNNITDKPTTVDGFGITDAVKTSDIKTPVSSANKIVTENELADKQDALTAGDNITIIDNVVSATGGADIPLSVVNGKLSITFEEI